MTKDEAERVFMERLPVCARVNGISLEKATLEFSCIFAIRKVWRADLGREAVELELLDKSRRSVTVVPMEDVFLSENNGVEEEDFFKCQRTYEKYFGMITPGVCDKIDFCLREGMEAQLIVRIMEYAYEQNKRSWNYIAAILKDKLKNNIKTLDAFECKEKERAEQLQKRGQAKVISGKSKFNNYNDTNKPDYSDFGEQILKDMLGEA